MRSQVATQTERGTSLLMVAGAMFFIIGVAAIAIDLGALRYDLRADRLASDAAASAGAAEVDPFSASDAQDACNVAWAYLLLNLGDEGSPVTAPDCSDLAGACNPAIARVTDPAGSAGPYTFTITHPIPDGHPMLGSQGVNTQIDGVPCQRFGVRIDRTRDFVFAAALGFGAGSTEVRSVAKIGAGVGAGEVVPLLVLEPIACDALYNSGQGKLTVTAYNDSPGFVVVDSNGSKANNPNMCGSSSWTIDAKGTTQGWIRALPTATGIPPAILSFALSGPPGNPVKAYDPADLTTAAVGVPPGDPIETWFRLYPRPLPTSRRITRAPIDWRYNCKTGYPDYPIDLANPLLGGIGIDDCPTTPAPHIDNLVAQYANPPAGPGGPPAGFARWTDAGYPCLVNDGSLLGPSIIVSGNWWVDCPGGLVIIDKMVEFSGGDVVFEGGVELRSSAVLRMNPLAGADQMVFVRSGSITKVAQALIEMRRTFVYLADGVVGLVGGPGGLQWTAPTGGNFEDLALWSESSQPHEIGGQAGNTLTGTFFTPMANPFALKGQGGQFQTDAQFLTRRLEIGGDSEVRMRPDPDRQTLIPIREVRLIR